MTTAIGVRQSLSFFVPGIPVPGGSKKSFALRRKVRGKWEYTGRTATADSSGQRGKDWRASVQHAAVRALGAAPLLDGPLSLDVTFTLPRPKSHYGKRKGLEVLKPGAPRYHTVKPDATKLTRAVEDALNGVAIADDSRIAIQAARKVYGPKPGAQIAVLQIRDLGAVE